MIDLDSIDLDILRAIHAGRPGWTAIPAEERTERLIRVAGGKPHRFTWTREASSRAWNYRGQRLRFAGLLVAYPWRLTDAGRARLEQANP
jgi:hypothetical protein